MILRGEKKGAAAGGSKIIGSSGDEMVGEGRGVWVHSA